MKMRILTLSLLASTTLLATQPSVGADLKQLAEQLVNKKEQPQGDMPRTPIREGGRTVGAGQRSMPDHPQPHPAGIAIQEEGPT